MMGIFVTREDEKNKLIIERFIAGIVGTGKTKAEARKMIDSQGLTVHDMREALDLLDTVFELGVDLMHSKREPVSEGDLYFSGLISDVVASNPEIVRKPGGGSPDRKG